MSGIIDKNKKVFFFHNLDYCVLKMIVVPQKLVLSILLQYHRSSE